MVTAALREYLLNNPWPEHAFLPGRREYTKEVTRIYGPVAEGCIALQDKVGLYAKDTAPLYKEKETQIREILAQMPKASEIEAMLGAVGMKMDEFYALYNEKKIADAKLYAKELKDRYTVLCMYYDLFGKH